MASAPREQRLSNIQKPLTTDRLSAAEPQGNGPRASRPQRVCRRRWHENSVIRCPVGAAAPGTGAVRRIWKPAKRILAQIRFDTRCGASTIDRNPYSWISDEDQETALPRCVHAHRTPRRDRDHRDSRKLVPTGAGTREGQGHTDALPE